MNECLAAHTLVTDNSPAYINASRRGNGDVRVTVRGQGVVTRLAVKGETGEGKPVYESPEASIDMTRKDFRKWLTSALDALNTAEAVPFWQRAGRWFGSP